MHTRNTFFYLGFLSRTLQFTGQQGKGKGISLTLFRMGEKLSPTSFLSVTSKNVRDSPENFQTFSFSLFARCHNIFFKIPFF